jgi:hypothetical protein
LTVNDSVVEPGVVVPQPDLDVEGDAALAVVERLTEEQPSARTSTPASAITRRRRRVGADHGLTTASVTTESPLSCGTIVAQILYLCN